MTTVVYNHGGHNARYLPLADSEMMALANVLLCFAVLHCIANAASDVCSNITYTTIDDIRRSTAYDTTTDLCDRGVIKDGSWYRFKSAAGDKMPESNPGTNHCGTFIPIWMNGNHPARLGETVSRDACAPVPFRRPPGCGVEFAIKVVNCGGFFLYQLKEPKYCNYAYCAGRLKVGYFLIWQRMRVTVLRGIINTEI